MNRLARLLRDRAGVASLEAALVTMLLLVPICGGLADGGLILVAWMRVSRAEHAALLYAWGNGANTGGMLTAAVGAFGSPAPTVNTSAACYCLSAAQSWSRGAASGVSCSTTCSSGYTLTEFVSVTVAANVALPMPVPFFARNYQISTTAVGRVL